MKAAPHYSLSFLLCSIMANVDFGYSLFWLFIYILLIYWFISNFNDIKKERATGYFSCGLFRFEYATHFRRGEKYQKI